MERLLFYPLSLTYKVKGDSAVVYLFGRTKDHKQICLIDSSLRPYFYVVPKEPGVKQKLEGIWIEKKGTVFRVTEVKEVKRRYMEKETTALKVYVNLPAGVPQIRSVIKEWEIIKGIYEYDIPFTRRYLLDKGITPMTLVEAEGEPVKENMKLPVIKAKSIRQVSDEVIRDLKVLSLDIETYNPGGKIMDPSKNPVLMIGLYSKNFRKVITWKRFRTDDKTIEFADSESAMLERFKEIIGEFKPDIISGYSSDAFDLPYIKERAEKHRISMDIGLDCSELSTSGRVETKAGMTGIVHIDIFKFIRRAFATTLKTDTYTLDAVAHELLGENKISVDMENFAEVWDKGGAPLAEYCRYNLKDAKLAYGLTMKVLPNITEFVKLTGLQPEDLHRMGFSQVVEWYIIKQAVSRREIIPERPHYNEVSRRRMATYTGAFVYEPRPGLYDNITIFDFRSLYPTIINSHNISVSTINCSCCKKENMAPVEGREYWFCKKRKGFIPSIIGELIKRRMEIKQKELKKHDLFLEATEQSLKILANSFYGYFGFFNARWYCLECAESTTAWGRSYIKDVIKQSEETGFEVLYSDTDSVFLLLGKKSRKEVQGFIDRINSKLPGMMELEYEGFYPSGIFVATKGGPAGAKKKYALIDENHNIKITGFETVRRNWSQIAKDLQEKVLQIILKDKDTGQALRYVNKVIEELKKHKVYLKNVTIKTQLQKELKDYAAAAPHVKIARRMEEQGIEVGPGLMIRYVITKGKGNIGDRARLPEEVDQGDYDADYYIDHQVLPAVESIFLVLGYSREEIVEGKKQKRLGSFFG